MDAPPIYHQSEGYHAQDTPESATTADPQLPEYTRRPSHSVTHGQRELREHTYSLKDRKGNPWAVLNIRGDAVLSKHMPTFFEGQPITGSLVLNLKSQESIIAINILVQGLIIHSASPSDDVAFLNISSPLWSNDMGDPRDPSSRSEYKYNEKLQGDYSWPFSIKLPATVALSGSKIPSGEAQIYRLPQTFMERHIRATINYEIILHLKRTKMRLDSKIQVPFGYIPTTRPDPPSALRRLAYQENSPLMGPDIDPAGWHTLRPVPIRGVIFNDRPVDGRCILSLAKPLCYTRGSVIPCSLAIECNDEQALDQLSSPFAVVLRLRRRIKFHRGEAYWQDMIEYSDSATWWPSNASHGVEPNKRRIEGEVHLKKDMKPSTAISHFIIEYSVVLCPFKATAFVSATSDPLIAEPVKIATTFAVGPRPRVYSPPKYELGTSPSSSRRVVFPDWL